MKVKVDVQCPGCEGKTSVLFKKPSLFCPTTMTFGCIDCQSKVLVKFRKLPKTPTTQINVQTLSIQPSAFLIAMKKEEEAHNALPIGENVEA